MLTPEQLDALRTLAGWRRRLYEADSSEAYFRQCDELRKPWFAPGSLDPFGNIWDEEATAPDWQTIRPDLAAALEADAVAPLGERGKVRGAVLEVVRDAAQEQRLTLFRWDGATDATGFWWLIICDMWHRGSPYVDPFWFKRWGDVPEISTEAAALVAAIDHLAKQ